MKSKKKFDTDGMRLTDCCGCWSTYNEYGELYCKGCYHSVDIGQGDGTEYKGGGKHITPVAYVATLVKNKKVITKKTKR